MSAMGDQAIRVSGGNGSEVVRVCGGRAPRDAVASRPGDARNASHDASDAACRLIVRGVGVREVLDHELDRLERPLK